MRRRYAIMARLEVLHDFYETQRSGDLEWVPIPSSRMRMEAAGILYRSVGSALYLLAPVNEEDEPRLPWFDAKPWVFQFRIRNPHFASWTHLPGFDGRRKYYFTSHQGLTIGDKRYLHVWPQAHQEGKAYEPGDQVWASGGQYECTRPAAPGSPAPSGDSTFWRWVGDRPRMAEPLMVLPASGWHRHPVALGKQFEWQVFYPGTTGFDFDVPATPLHSLNLPEPASEILLDLRNISGLCQLVVNGEPTLLYRDESMTGRDFLGAVALYPSGHEDASRNLLTAEGKLQGPEFCLHFGSKSAHYLFVARSAEVTAIKEKDSKVVFQQLPGSSFLSELPLPIRERPQGEFFLESNSLGQVGPLGLPSPYSLTQMMHEGRPITCLQRYLSY